MKEQRVTQILHEIAEREAHKLGLHAKFASERPLGMRPLDLKKDLEATRPAFIEAGRKCIEEDGADADPGLFWLHRSGSGHTTGA